MATFEIANGTIQTEGIEDLQKKLKIILPKEVRRMAFTLDAKVAAEGRKLEQRQATDLEMGKPQRKSNRWSGHQIRSAWDASRGWVSITRPAAAKIGGQFSMAHFSFKGNTKNVGFVEAKYTNQVANLWGHETRPYRSASPFVGQGRGKMWRAGEIRPKRYDWGETAAVLASMESDAITQTDKQFEKEFKGM